MVYHCAFGLCKSDSRHKDRPSMANVTWHFFPKPHRDLERCKRWVNACGRKGFTIDKVNKNTIMCSRHFVGGKGPTPDYPDPIPVQYSPSQDNRFSLKAPRLGGKALSDEVLAVQGPPKKLKFFEQTEVLSGCVSSLMDVEQSSCQAQTYELFQPVPGSCCEVTPVLTNTGSCCETKPVLTNAASRKPVLVSTSTQTEEKSPETVDAKRFESKSTQAETEVMSSSTQTEEKNTDSPA